VTTRVTSSRLVGRGAELARLEAALADAAAGRPSLAFVAGDSGVGKSRLIAELEDRARADGVCVLHGESVELGEGELPFGPLVGALRPLARSRDDVLDELDDVSRAELARLLPAFAPPGHAAGPDAAPERAQARLFEAVLGLLDRLGAGGSVLLVLEDLHWADPSTRAFVAFLGRSLCLERVLVVASYRLDELHRRHPLRPLLAEIERDPSVARIELPPLTRDEVACALEDILGEDPSPPLVDRLYARTEGNPLFLEELLAAGPDGRGALPATLRDALMVRVDRLSDDAQALLRVLAIAQIADHALLAQASGLDAAALGAAVREAVAAHVVVAGDDGQHAFRHALLREVVQDDLLPGEREQLHLALARALEDRAGGAQVAAGVAFHYAAAGAQPAALAASVRAAAAAERIHAYDEAAGLVERALELWERVDDPEVLAGAGRLELLSRAAEHHVQGSDQARAEPLLRAALDAVDRDREPRPAAALLERLARVQWRLGRSDEALTTAREGLELVGADASSPERARLLAWFAKTRMLQGRYRDAVRAGREALAAATAADDAAALSGALNALGVALIHQGEIDEGVAHLRDAMARAQAEGRPEDRRAAAVNLADALHLAGRLEEAREVARQAADEAQRDGHLTPWLALTVADLAFEAGEWAEAERWMPSSERRYAGLELANVELRRAEAALGRGEHAGIAERLERIAPLVADSGEAQFHGAFGALLAELRRRGGDLDGARDAVDAALDRIEFCTDDGLRLARVSAAGITVEADRAQRGRDLGDPEETARALAGVDDLLLRVEAAAADGGALQGAWLRDARAEAARATGADDPELWAAAAEAWEALGRPYPALVARRRQAEALVVRDDRDAAGPVAAAALARAREIGAGWLAGELEALMARARLRHDGAAPPSVAPGAEAADEPFGLTARERQVLALVARGATNREIGAELFMAEKTASVHVSRILAKLDVRTRTEAAAVAHRLGLAE
jgi:ATP/maltotriose-dependent transcriptional regulator MalT